MNLQNNLPKLRKKSFLKLKKSNKHSNYLFNCRKTKVKKMKVRKLIAKNVQSLVFSQNKIMNKKQYHMIWRKEKVWNIKEFRLFMKLSPSITTHLWILIRFLHLTIGYLVSGILIIKDQFILHINIWANIQISILLKWIIIVDSPFIRTLLIIHLFTQLILNQTISIQTFYQHINKVSFLILQLLSIHHTVK